MFLCLEITTVYQRRNHSFSLDVSDARHATGKLLIACLADLTFRIGVPRHDGRHSDGGNQPDRPIESERDHAKNLTVDYAANAPARLRYGAGAPGTRRDLVLM